MDGKINLGGGNNPNDATALHNVVTASGNTLVQNVLNIAYTWAGIICVIVIIVAGFYYVTSNGNAQTITKAKNAILGAVIGLVIILLAFAITNFVIGRF